MMTKKGSIKMVIFMTLRAAFLVFGCGHMSCLYNKSEIRQT